MTLQIAVIGTSEPDPVTDGLAEAVGTLLAEAGVIVLCGGLGGVMAAACRGARSAGGLTVGFLPGRDPAEANPFVEVVVPTDLGEARNALVAGAAGAVIAVGGGFGTLSEIALALRRQTPVVGVATWTLVRPDGGLDTSVVRVDRAEEAVSEALRLAALGVDRGGPQPSSGASSSRE